MDSSTAIQSAPPTPTQAIPSPAPAKKRKSPLWRGLEAIASLKLTVLLFALAMFLVFFGTLAQVELGIWNVVQNYFRSLIVWIPIRILSMRVLPINSPVGNLAIPFPGGWLIGGALFTNLLAAHIVRFKLSWKRAGIVVLHFGIMLMMLGEFMVGKFAVEGMMRIEQGQTVNYTGDTKHAEIAVIDVTDPKRTEDDIIAIYEPAILSNRIDHPDLPFAIDVLEYHKNADLIERRENEPEIADRGRSRAALIKPLPEVTGVDPDQQVDSPAALVQLKAKNGDNLGKYILWAKFIRGEFVTIGDKKYEITLRPKRIYRNYTVYLEKAEEVKHPNSPMAKEFSSYVVLNDPEHGVADRKVHIYMNAPMRHRGEAFFQAHMGSDENGEMYTILQVVRNELKIPGIGDLPFWLLPYISCIIVAIGMLMHFGVKLVGFLDVQLRVKT